MITVMALLIVAVIVIAIWAAVRPGPPILWVAVLLLGIIEALQHFGAGRIG